MSTTKLIALSVVEGFFVNLLLATDGSGHSSNYFGALLEITFFSLGLSILIPALIFFVISLLYKKRQQKLGRQFDFPFLIVLHLIIFTPFATYFIFFALLR